MCAAHTYLLLLMASFIVFSNTPHVRRETHTNSERSEHRSPQKSQWRTTHKHTRAQKAHALEEAATFVLLHYYYLIIFFSHDVCLCVCVGVRVSVRNITRRSSRIRACCEEARAQHSQHKKKLCQILILATTLHDGLLFRSYNTQNVLNIW